MKILVVDDDESVLDAVALVLEEAGYTVGTTLKGEETYKEVEKFQPNLILLDVLMSGSDGREICKKLKENPASKKIPIIMISAHPGAGKSALQFGAEEFLPKPFSSEELLQRVQKYNRT